MFLKYTIVFALAVLPAKNALSPDPPRQHSHTSGFSLNVISQVRIPLSIAKFAYYFIDYNSTYLISLLYNSLNFAIFVIYVLYIS